VCAIETTKFLVNEEETAKTPWGAIAPREEEEEEEEEEILSIL
jgi:hypothetical protein